MLTFASIKGKGALQEVFRIKFPDIPISEVHRITAALPDEAAIADKLQEMKEAGDEPSIIMWALDANAKALKQFCYVDENGNLQGEYATAFKQAIRLEGTKKAQSKHPSGIVIANEPLADIVPMLYDKGSKQAIAGMEMNELEKMGICKFDILELKTLQKLHGVVKLLATGRMD
jgi:DNA polymerase III alpha subunit